MNSTLKLSQCPIVGAFNILYWLSSFSIDGPRKSDTNSKIEERKVLPLLDNQSYQLTGAENDAVAIAYICALMVGTTRCLQKINLQYISERY